MSIHSHLPHDVRLALITHCASALWHQRYGSRTTYYLAVEASRREAEAVLRAAEHFLADLAQVAPVRSSKRPVRKP